MGPNIKDIGAYIKAVAGIGPQNAADGATVNGSGVDRQGLRSCVVAAHVGAVTGAPTATSIQFKLQKSDDNSTFTDVSGASTTITAADSSAELDLDISGLKRYVRVVAAVSFTGGTSPTADIAATLILGGADKLPA